MKKYKSTHALKNVILFDLLCLHGIDTLTLYPKASVNVTELLYYLLIVDMSWSV